jgi:hypothetical protein
MEEPVSKKTCRCKRCDCPTRQGYWYEHNWYCDPCYEIVLRVIPEMKFDDMRGASRTDRTRRGYGHEHSD